MESLNARFKRVESLPSCVKESGVNQQEQSSKFAIWKTQIPMFVGIGCFLGFMKAESAENAGLFGTLAVVGIAWQIHRQRSWVRKLGEPIMELGVLFAEPPPRLRPWHMLAAIAFALLGLAMFFSMSDSSVPARLGMSLVTWAIVGAWLVMLSERLRVFGAAVMGLGFVAAGAMMVWEAWSVLNAAEGNAGLQAVRWSVFGGLLLLVGITMLIGLIQNSGRTPIYEAGVVGSRGYVAWEDAKRLELVESNGRTKLTVGAQNGWTLLIDVPAGQRDDVARFIAAKRPNNLEEPGEILDNSHQEQET